LADDSITIQKVVRITLADGDYNLITVDNGTEALERLKTEQPDLVLADVVMPGKDGYQVCEEIKKNPGLSHIPVILLAGSFEGFDEMKGAEAGADGYIIKPFESQTLISKVEEMLNKPKPKITLLMQEAKKMAEEMLNKPKPKIRKPEEQPPAKPAPAPAPQAAPEPLPVEPEVKDFMDTLSAEMDQPAKETPPAQMTPEEPIAEPVQTAEPVPESALQEEELGQAAPVAEPATEPVLEAAVSEEQLWEAQPVEAEPAPGETVLEAEPVSEQELWAEPVSEESVPPGEQVMEAETLEETQPLVEPGVAVAAEPVTEWTPESEPAAVPVEIETPSPETPAEVQEAVLAAEPETISAPEAVPEAAEKPEAYAAMEAMPEEGPAPELGTEGPSAMVHAKVAEAAEDIATAAASGLSRSELVELIRATVEKVAWEVVPEMAEALIKERITRWEVQTQ
jgi:CheY-like chemotaxis protein